MAMTYQELEAKLVDYIYDELAEAEREAFEAGLTEHPDLAEEAKAHARTRAIMSSLEPVQAPQAVLDEVMRHVRAEAASQEQTPWLERLFGFLMQPAVATAFIFLMVASASLMLADDPLDKNAQVEKQPYAVATKGQNQSAAAMEETEPMAAKEALEAPSKQVETLSVAAAPPPTAVVAPKEPEVQVAAAAPRARKARKKGSQRKRSKVDDELRKVGIQLAEQNSGLSRNEPLDREFEVAEAPIALGMNSLGLGAPEPAGKAGSQAKAVDQAAQPSRTKGYGKAGKGSSAGSNLLRAYRQQVKQGRYKEAGETLKALAKYPEFKGVAAREKRRLSKMRKTSPKKPPKSEKSKAVPAP